MNELFLHYLWQYQYFDKAELLTTAGETVVVFDPGQRNTHAGPDFFNARVRIDEIEWVGSVEIHINASGWVEHHHNLDPAYDNVVLHVVWKCDQPVYRHDGTEMSTLTLLGRVDHKLLLEYQRLAQNPEPIPCASRLSHVPNVSRLSMLNKTLTDRLQAKSQHVLNVHQRFQGDWEETCYHVILRNFGFKVNTEAFSQLAQALPYKFLLRHADKQEQVEAFLFGQAGFLEDDIDDEYYRLLQREYRFLSQKYQLTAKRVEKAQWRFLRLRPANFPTIRIAQFAALIFKRRKLFSAILARETAADLQALFTIVQSQYWLHHYHFFKEIKEKVTPIGEASIDNIVINSVVPLLVAYGKTRDDTAYMDRAIRILQQLHAESNMIIKHWKSLGMSAHSAFESQALVQLYGHYCLRRKCLDCNIGAAIVNPRGA